MKGHLLIGDPRKVRSPCLKLAKGKPIKAIPFPYAFLLTMIITHYASSKQDASVDHYCLLKTQNCLPHKPLWDNFIKGHPQMSVITR
jgi:hypothetical protein